MKQRVYKKAPRAALALLFIAAILFSVPVFAAADNKDSVVTEELEYVVFDQDNENRISASLVGTVIQSNSAANDYTYIREMELTFDGSKAIYEVEKIAYYPFVFWPRYRKDASLGQAGYYGFPMRYDVAANRYLPVTDTLSFPDGTSYSTDGLYMQITSDNRFYYAGYGPEMLPDRIDPKEYFESTLTDKIFAPDEKIAVFPVELDAAGGAVVTFRFTIKTPTLIGQAVPGKGYSLVHFVHSWYRLHTSVSITAPEDAAVLPGDTATMDVSVSSIDEKHGALDWYGTFQILMPGETEWKDVNPDYLAATTSNTNPELTLTADEALNGSLFRYKYVHRFEQSFVVYSNPAVLTVNAPPPTIPPTGDATNARGLAFSAAWLVVVLGAKWMRRRKNMNKL